MNVPKIHFKLWANLKTGESLVQYQPNECRGRTEEKILKDEQFHGARAKEEAGDMGAQPSLTATDSQFWPILPQKPDVDYQIHYNKCIDDRIANTF